MDNRDAAGSRRVLEEILEHHPDFAPAHALLGQILVAEQRLDELDDWFEHAPPESNKYADYWLTLGDWAADRDQQAQATRAYWEAARRDPNDSTAWTRLALSVRHLRGSGSREVNVVSGEQLDDLDRRIANLLLMRKQFFNFIGSSQTSQRYATEVAKNLSKLGRNWEAEAWAAAATTLEKDPSDELVTVRATIIRKLKEDPSWLSQKRNPALAMDLSRLPAPMITAEPTRTQTAVVPVVASVGHLRLREESDQWGLKSIGAKNNPTDAHLGPLIRSTGVGGGAIDYDLDGRADALVMGAGGTMLKTDSFPNELMRNLGKAFVRVTNQAEVGHTDFGQGLVVGDFNEDGFPDLFFSNLGKNRLLRNNGDGSFTDCSELLDDGEAQEWTMCGAFVDVNQDGIADLITTNYCDTVANLDKACPNSEGKLGPCHPLKFPAKSDQFFAGTADGRLVDVTLQWTPEISPGRGMGILAGSLMEGELGVLIANDMSANEFYSRANDASERMTESAAVRGVAVDARTRTQASMGIATGDFDGDGDLDIYVTGFAREHNIYYEQITPGFWKDNSSKVGLVEPTLMVVGFGTEAIDLDDDGVDELVVTNGHIGDFIDDVIRYEQPFQLFRRGATGKFDLLDDDSWGEYFSTSHVGRALWTIDVNGDGRNDIMITHTYEQLRLLVNRSRDDNDRISFKLVGTQSSRDAIGAVVRFDCAGRERTLWCLSGHGYMCSNEQILRAGLGHADRVENVTVTWQDGSIDEIGMLDANAQYVIVQGDETAFETASF
jgi:tetratricopeptide (TPR) repeat protein